MGVNVKEFSVGLDNIYKKINKEIENIIKDVVIEIYDSLLEPAPLGTPVITGYAVSNWRINIDSPLTEPVGSKENVNTTDQQQRRTSFLNSRLLDMNIIYISNAVEYIVKLNYQTAKQSPTNFVEKSIMRGKNKLATKRVIK